LGSIISVKECEQHVEVGASGEGFGVGEGRGESESASKVVAEGISEGRGVVT
jgi:hypothetical protein